MVTDMASGVLDGTEVWLAGQKVGLVRSVALRPPSSDTTERVAITMDVLNEYVSLIRKNSDVQIRPGGRLIGSPVIYLDIGTSTSPGVREGDTLRAQAQAEARSGLLDASSLGDSLTGIVGTVSTIKSDFDSTFHDLAGITKVSRQQASAAREALDNFSQRTLGSRGTVAAFIRNSSALKARTTRISALADSIGAASNGTGELGRFRRDSTLILQAHKALASVAELRARVARYAGDSVEGATMARQLDLAHAQLDSVVQDAKHHPMRYIAF
jgi:ABC-type transporter Mla subunit MlaD